ncbi:methylisocitrate lyase [Gammaproteobacteria bacterium]|nr:methylisocitrate lyase [Gammaproteobacteria bacterium]
MRATSPGQRLRQAVTDESPMQLVGAICALHARMAEQAGYRAIYLSGGGVAAASNGIPDLGITQLEDVLIDVRRITAAATIPLMVDADTGWGGAFNIARSVREIERAGAAGLHIEDQVQAKRCGHRPNKAIVSASEMRDRVLAAVDARRDDDFVIMARTDALAVEGLDAAIDRACQCVEAGADMIFPEAMTELHQYQRFSEAVKVPILANITEFGATPLFTLDQLKQVGVGIALYPLSAMRMMNRAAETLYTTLRGEGTQASLIDQMQTRAELYELLGYHDYEQRLDALFAQTPSTEETA